jgi:hypothetical protein
LRAAGFLTATRTNKNEGAFATAENCAQSTVIGKQAIATIVPSLQANQAHHHQAHDSGQENTEVDGLKHVKAGRF